MQQPNQSPPGCNPYAVNNKGIAHLLLILLLVAGLSVVGMFLFKMVSGNSLDVMGAKVAQVDPACSASIKSCGGNEDMVSCQVSYNPYTRGNKCVLKDTDWNYAGCQITKPTCSSTQQVRSDCLRWLRGTRLTGSRCVASPPVTPPPSPPTPPTPPVDGEWNFPGCRTKIQAVFLTCASTEEKYDDCRKNDRGMYGTVVIEGVRCGPLRSASGPCTAIYAGSAPLRCPSDYEVKSCYAFCGYVQCSGAQCVRKAASPPPSTPIGSVCGNGKLEAAEQCDAGPGNALCPALCSTTCRTNNCTTPPPATVCGNGVIERGEQCDTGSSNGVCPGYCSSSCKISPCYASNPAPVCGNGKVERGEACDAGSSNGTCPARCSSSCQVNACGSGTPLPQARCGNGVQEGGEQCDTGSGNASCPSPCSASCNLNSCGGGGGGGGGSTPPPSNNCPTCVTASGSFKTAEGKPVNGADVIVYLGNGSTAGTAKTDASGNYSLRFDKKGINFAIRSVSTSYKPAKSSYPECRGMSGVGYEDCWFKPQDMSGVDFVSTAPSVNAGRKPPTAEIASLSSINPVPQNRKINTVIRVNAYGSKVGKVELYANPAYSSAISPKNPRCSDEAVGSYPIYSTQKRWVKVGEAVYNASNAFTTGFVTITWDTGALPCTMADNRTDGVCTGSYFLGANVEDLGDMSEIGGKTPVNVLRCTSNPVGNACSPNNTYYQGLCGNSSYSRLDIVPTDSTDPVSSIVIAAKGTSVNGIGPKMDLYVKGALVKSWFVTPTLSNYTYSHDAKIKLLPSDIKIGFSNDASDAAKKEDRNLFVDYMSLYGVKYQTEHPSVLSMGVWDSVTKMCQRTVPLAMKSELLACNGYFQYNTPSINLGNVVTVVATGSVYKDVGSKMDLYVNGSLVKTWYVPNKTGTYTYEAAGKVSSVRVGFSNDAYEVLKDPAGKTYSIGRDLIVDYVRVGNTVYQSEGPNVLAKGVWDSLDNTCTKIVSGAGNQRLSCNGYFDYPLAR